MTKIETINIIKTNTNTHFVEIISSFNTTTEGVKKAEELFVSEIKKLLPAVLSDLDETFDFETAIMDGVYCYAGYRLDLHWSSIQMTEEDKASAILVTADDWEGLYVNGKLVDEGHTLNEGSTRTQYFSVLTKQFNFSLEDLEEMDVSDKYYEEYLSVYGNLHSSFSDMLEAQ